MKTRRQIGIAVAALLAAVVVWGIQRGWKDPGSAADSTDGKPHRSDQAGNQASPHREPRSGFNQTLEVMARGGTPLEIDEATEYLDQITRVGTSLEPAEHAGLLAALERGTPPGMSEGSWSHLFNNACNVLALGRNAIDGKWLALLERTATDDPRLVMRLYALQHLGICYERADEESRKRLRLLVRRMLTDPDAQTAGTALVLWRKWEKTVAPGEDTSTDISRAIVTDTTRPVDVRVTALHAIGDDPKVIDLARGIAPDPSQPVILRKAAVSLIGRHGEAKDLPVLRECGRESPRLAQAGDPAIRMLEDRLAGKPEPVPTAY